MNHHRREQFGTLKGNLERRTLANQISCFGDLCFGIFITQNITAYLETFKQRNRG